MPARGQLKWGSVEALQQKIDEYSDGLEQRGEFDLSLYNSEIQQVYKNFSTQDLVKRAGRILQNQIGVKESKIFNRALLTGAV